MIAFRPREPMLHSQLRERLRISSSKNEKPSRPTRLSPNAFDVISLLDDLPAPSSHTNAGRSGRSLEAICQSGPAAPPPNGLGGAKKISAGRYATCPSRSMVPSFAPRRVAELAKRSGQEARVAVPDKPDRPDKYTRKGGRRAPCGRKCPHLSGL